jgi:hypothetical protein
MFTARTFLPCLLRQFVPPLCRVSKISGSEISEPLPNPESHHKEKKKSPVRL